MKKPVPPIASKAIHIHHLGLSAEQCAQAEASIEKLERPDLCVRCGGESRWVITWARHRSIMIVPMCRPCTDPEVATALEAMEAKDNISRVFGAGVAEA